MASSRFWRFAALGGVLALAVLAQRGPYQPYLEKLTEGAVNWDEGWIRADASVPLATGVPAAQAQVDAQRVAMMKAQASALRIAMRLPVNSEQRLEAFEALRIRVKGIVAGGEILSEGLRGHAYTLSLRVPINGVKGLAAEITKVTLPPPEPKPAPQTIASKPAPQASRGAPAPPSSSLASFASVTVDGMEAGIKPAIQPRILDPEGREVYSAKTVNPQVAKESMLARYVTPSGTGAGTPSSWNGPRDFTNLPLALVSPPWRLFAQRAPSARPRGQDQSLHVTALSASGPLKADIVVTEETAKKLREAEASSGVLAEGKVVVVVRADVGGVESRFRGPAAVAAPELARR